MSFGNNPPGSPPAGSPPGGYGPPPGGGYGGPPGVPPGGYGPPAGPPGGFPPGGQPYGVPQPPPGPLYAPGPGGGPPGFFPPEDIEPGKTWALVGQIVHPLWIVPLVTRDNAFALFHAKQSLVLAVIVFAANLVVGAITAVTCGFGGVLYLAFFAFLYPWIVGIMNAANGQYRPMPWFGGLADKYLSGMVADKRPGIPGPR